MHTLAICLQQMGHEVTGSDDEIYEPSRTALKKRGLLPDSIGWDENRINSELDLVILGMHARMNNPELIKAQQLGLNIVSYPEYIASQSINKKKVVIAGSHGKTTTTALIMQVLKYRGIDFDYLVGAELDGFDTMVKLSDAPIIVLEGDEYLSSCIDRRPKMMHYNGDLNVITGISWDHINVFETEEKYVNLFHEFVKTINPHAKTFVFGKDEAINKLYDEWQDERTLEKYYPIEVLENGNLVVDNKQYKIRMFGEHNRANISAAIKVCIELGITVPDFFAAISHFKGASKRLELIAQNATSKVFRDFAHSPSKVMASVSAMKEQFKNKTLIAFLELHTYSSLNENFLKHYNGTMDNADEAVVFYSPHTMEIKKMKMLDPEQVKSEFAKEQLKVVTKKEELIAMVQQMRLENCIVLLMSSGNFEGSGLEAIFDENLK